jgi:hypothetical protein
MYEFEILLYLPERGSNMKSGCRKWVLMVLTTLLLFSHPDIMMAQDETATTTQLRLFWHHNQSFTNRLLYIGNIGFKQELPYHNWIMMNFKPGVEWSAGSIVDLAGGIGLYYTLQKIIPNSFELRPWQGMIVHWPSLGRFSFDHYAKFEQRFNRSIGSKEQWSSVLRSRYRLNVIFPINHPGIIDKTLFVKINAELFWNIGKSIEERYVNKDRYSIGMGYRFNRNWRLEVYYLAEQSLAFSEEGFKVNSHILQVSLRTYIFNNS